MSQAMITAEDIGVCFRMDVNHNTNLKEWAIRALKRENKYEDFWALRGVSFDVQQGEVVGVIGSNGAGKSTLLKVISGIIQPTEGRVQCNARIVPMLELGSGFDYELTGEENIFLNGAILGNTRQFLESRKEEIIEFSELGRFIKMPLKTYSSGMTARLAFAIATVVEPEVLIVDEVLAVGDDHFQEKSHARMMSLMQGGTTVLYVSHNIAQIKKICSRALWLTEGQVQMFGDVNEVCDAYQNRGNA